MAAELRGITNESDNAKITYISEKSITNRWIR